VVEEIVRDGRRDDVQVLVDMVRRHWRRLTARNEEGEDEATQPGC